MDKLYKAFVRDKETRRCSELVMEYSSKKEFIEDLHGNGYTIYRNHLKEAKLYDWLQERTESMDPDDYDIYWKFTKIPQNKEEEDQMYEKYFKQYWDNKAYRYMYNRRNKR